MVKNKVIKNKGKSIRDRLLILSKKASYEYNLLLTRYVQERMLFRLSQSKYKEMFLLKGGALLYAHNRFKSRPTIDIDFLAKNLSNDKENIKTVFNDLILYHNFLDDKLNDVLKCFGNSEDFGILCQFVQISFWTLHVVSDDFRTHIHSYFISEFDGITDRLLHVVYQTTVTRHLYLDNACRICCLVPET